MKKSLAVVFAVFMLAFATSCTQRSCPTYSKVPVEKAVDKAEDANS